MSTNNFIEREQMKIIAAYHNENSAIYDSFVKQQFIYESTCFATYIQFQTARTKIGDFLGLPS